MSVVIETTKGIFTVDLYTEQRPKTCKNFLKLCKVKFYNYSLFHTVQSNFIAQAGDPTGIGKNGGESIFRRLYGDQATFYEGEQMPKIKHTKKGQISMVTVGDNLFGSQFFITLADGLDYLDGRHCVFGEIVEGLEIVEAFNETICDEQDRPYQDIRISHTVILDDPYDDPPGLEIPPRSPSPTPEMLASTRIGADEDLNDFDGMDDKEIAEFLREKEARAQATILEMIGDLPEADCAPPENVLFVCKLNPVTTDDDLEIIFSRFGKVKSCEVIRDKKTNDSLQYAFVEFEDEKSCEAAYFKMDNVLIDDRRIHVDFSQSVAKFKWKGKGRLEVLDQPAEKNKKELSGGRDRSDRRNQDNNYNRNQDNRRGRHYDQRHREVDRFDSRRGNTNGKGSDSRSRDFDQRRRDDERPRSDARDGQHRETERDHRHRDQDRGHRRHEEDRDKRQREVSSDHHRKKNRDRKDSTSSTEDRQRKVEKRKDRKRSPSTSSSDERQKKSKKKKHRKHSSDEEDSDRRRDSSKIRRHRSRSASRDRSSKHKHKSRH